MLVLAAATVGLVPVSSPAPAQAATCTVEASVDIVYDDPSTGKAGLLVVTTGDVVPGGMV